MPDALKANRRGIWALVLALAAGGGLVVGVGSIRTPTPAAMVPGVGVAGRLPATITLGTFNIHSGVGKSGEEDLSGTARTLEGMDIVALNEARGALLGEDQVRQLGRLTGLDGVFLPSERQYWHDAFGNGLLSRYPITSWQRVPLPAPKGGSRRNITVTSIAGGRLRIVLTHITRSDDMAGQLREAANVFLAQPEPAVLMGDLNAKGDHPVLAELLARPGVKSPLDSCHPRLAGQHIDWILVRGMEVLDSGVRDLGASDHPMVYAQLRFVGQSDGPTSRPESKGN